MDWHWWEGEELPVCYDEKYKAGERDHTAMCHLPEDRLVAVALGALLTDVEYTFFASINTFQHLNEDNLVKLALENYR